MEGRIRSLLLGCIYTGLALASINLQAADLDVEQVSKPVIQPEIERMEFDEAKINPDNFEIIASFGLINIENFNSTSIIAAKFAYRVSENFFTELEFGSATAGKSIVETFLDTDQLTPDERDYQYYLINVGYDIFPGESFITNNTTFNTALYALAGAGNTQFAGKDNFTFSWGLGYRVVVNNYLTAYFEARDHSFELDFANEIRRTNNMAITFGVGYYF